MAFFHRIRAETFPELEKCKKKVIIHVSDNERNIIVGNLDWVCRIYALLGASFGPTELTEQSPG